MDAEGNVITVPENKGVINPSGNPLPLENGQDVVPEKATVTVYKGSYRNDQDDLTAIKEGNIQIYDFNHGTVDRNPGELAVQGVQAGTVSKSTQKAPFTSIGEFYNAIGSHEGVHAGGEMYDNFNKEKPKKNSNSYKQEIKAR